MLLADTSHLQSAVRKAEIERQYSHLLLYIDRLNSITSQAVLIAGFATMSLSADSLQSIGGQADPHSDEAANLTTQLFVLSAGGAVALSVWVVWTSLHVSNKAEQLALEGEQGSVAHASAALIKQSRIIIRVHTTALCFVGLSLCVLCYVFVDHTTTILFCTLLAAVGAHAAFFMHRTTLLFSGELSTTSWAHDRSGAPDGFAAPGEGAALRDKLISPASGCNTVARPATRVRMAEAALRGEQGPRLASYSGRGVQPSNGPELEQDDEMSPLALNRPLPGGRARGRL